MSLFINGLKYDALAGDPGSPVEGQAWYNVTDHRFKIYVAGGIHEVAHLDDLTSDSISVDSAGFDGILSIADTDVQAALETIDQRIITSGSTPSSGSDGRLWYNNSVGFNSLMAYDSSRSKWLSVSEWTLNWGHDLADGELLRGSGIIIPGIGTGIIIPQNTCIKRITARTTSDNNLKSFAIFVDGVSAYNFTLIDGTFCSTFITNLADITIPANSTVWVYADAAGIGAANVAVTLWCSWYAVYGM